MSSDYHMLDTNIILSSVLPNDKHKENVERYLKKEFLRYISNTSCKEAENKILIIKRLSLFK